MDGASAGPTTVSLAELEAQITELAGHLNAAQYRWLVLIEEFDRRLGWVDGKLASCAHWLNFKCGLNLGAARERVRVAHALTGLPRIAASMARGELSYSKVRALTRVAGAATEESLLMIALHGTAHHVESIVRCYRRAQQAEELSREERQQASRSVEYYYDENGSLVLRARLPALSGALMVKALERALGEAPASELSVDLGAFTYQERRADALAHMAERYLNGAKGDHRSADRYQVVVHVDAETLKDHGAGRCHLERGPTLPLETVRRLACDGSIVPVLESAEGSVLDVGRKSRSIPAPIRRALNARDAGCRFPGCTYQRHLDAHHISHWADGGETKLANLLMLCRWHHRLVHEGGILIERQQGGGWRFMRPDGRSFAPQVALEPRAYDGTELEAAHTARGIRIDTGTAATRWRGERMDYDLAVWVLSNRPSSDASKSSALIGDELKGELDVPDVSAETSITTQSRTVQRGACPPTTEDGS